jgi:hypothetical protein
MTLIELRDNALIYKDHNGILHNDFGPSIKGIHSSQWYKHGIRHNENGPAIIYKDKRKIWVLNGKEITEEEFNRIVK